MNKVEIAIIGSGFAGLGMAIRLKQTGQTNFMIFERAESVGGVWRDNVYPGAACDVESHLYSLSFAPYHGWSHKFARQPEIKAYLEDCIQRFNLQAHLKLQHTVQQATWLNDQACWQLETNQGSYVAQNLILAVGALSEPAMPHIPGLETFAGTVFHSARWHTDYDLHGKQVAVIGTGASSIQFIPEIQPLVERLTVFQRTAAWVVPRGDRPFKPWEKALFKRFPILQKLQRGWVYGFREMTGVGFRQTWVMRGIEALAKRHLRNQVPDQELRAKLTPNYTIGCKRILISDDYYPAMSQPNVDLVTTSIDRIEPDALIDAQGRRYPVDTIIFGTGFQVTTVPFARVVYGRAGQTLNEEWQGSPQAHLGTTVHGFPNLFFIQGPNTGLGHTSVIYMMEAQIEYVVQALQYLQTHAVTTLEPHPEAQAAFVQAVDQRMHQTVWMNGGCASWYIDETGRNSTLWPQATFTFRRRLAQFEPAEYQLR